MNLFDGLAKLFKPNPKNVAARQATKQARIEARYKLKQAKIDSGESADWTEFWQSAIESGHSTLDPLSAGGAFSTQENGFGREIYEQTHDSAHAVGSGVLGTYGIDANYEQSPYEAAHYGSTAPVTIPTGPAPSTDSGGISSTALIVGGLAIAGLAIMSGRK